MARARLPGVPGITILMPQFATWTGFGGVRHSTRPKSVPVMLSSLWRSGPDAGIVGVGRVLSEPQLHPTLDVAEQRFVLSEEEGTSEATRVLVHVRPCAFVAKDDLRTIPELQGHQIITAPMGTVFPISDLGWDALRRVLPPVPEVLAEPRGALPQVFAWAQRAKGVLPMPGGYAGYLDSLRAVCALVEEERPSTSELDARLEALLEVTSTAARLRASFLRKVAIVAVQNDLCSLGSWTEQWRHTGDDRIVVALLHSRCQLIGELLAAAREPQSTEQLLRVANDRYGMGWDTQTQIANRRGWLQSAGMLEVTEAGLIQTTVEGRRLLDELGVFTSPRRQRRSSNRHHPHQEGANVQYQLPPGTTSRI